ncbi:LysR family transcriptional regulator [Salinithrix halophila]|uniref:LysR family transcriptional regulator n=1 Tax=Salinithrix halophila TaxID=1485204 RepID=A0ABV8JGL6_9BACL
MEQSLRVFITVAKTRHFSRAAEELHMTQPAVSQQIRSLENRYHTRLLERNNKSVQLTPAGEILLREGLEILNQYARMERLIQDLTHSASGPLSIGASYTFGEYVLPRILSSFCTRYEQIDPKVTIHNTKRIGEGVVRREMDIGIVEGELSHPQLEMKPVADDELVLVVPSNHPLAEQKEVKASELRGERWILREPGSGTREAADRLFRGAELTPDTILEFGSTQVIKESVETGLGIAVLSSWSIRKELLLGTLCSLRVQDVPMRRHFYTLTRATSFRTKAMDLFLAFLRQELRRRTLPSC